MIVVTKNGKTATLRDATQLAAFKKAGWKETVYSPPVTMPEHKEQDIDTLKAEADALGLRYHWNIGTEKLKQLIEENKIEL